MSAPRPPTLRQPLRDVFAVSFQKLLDPALKVLSTGWRDLYGLEGFWQVLNSTEGCGSFAHVHQVGLGGQGGQGLSRLCHDESAFGTCVQLRWSTSRCRSVADETGEGRNTGLGQSRRSSPRTSRTDRSPTPSPSPDRPEPQAT